MDSTNPSSPLKRGGSDALVSSTSQKHPKMDATSTATASPQEHDPSVCLEIRKIFSKSASFNPLLSFIRIRVEEKDLLGMVTTMIVRVATQYQKRHPEWQYMVIEDLDLLGYPSLAEKVYKDIIAISSSEEPEWEKLVLKYAVERTVSPSRVKHTGEETTIAIQNYLSQFSKTMLDVIAGDKDLPQWNGPTRDGGEHSDFFRGLCLPQVAGYPSLLLHELGCYNKEAFDKLLESLFNVQDKFLIVINTSGSGKTRLLLEGLVRYWGIYFVGSHATSSLGSEDLGYVLSGIEENEGFKANPVSEEDLKMNEAIARRQYFKVLLARTSVFTHFLNLNLNQTPSSSEDNLRLAWLKIQIRPESFFNKDIFRGVMDLLNNSTNDYLERGLTKSLEDVKDLLTHMFPLSTSSRRLCCIIDEAQALATRAPNSFLSRTSGSPRSLLKPLTEHLRKSLARHNWFMYLSGTSNSLEIIETTSGSNVARLSGNSLQKLYHLESFVDASSQAAYIRKFVPPALADNLSDFLAWVFTWTRGRFRFTATLIELLLVSGFRSPHTVLNFYIKSFCGGEFEPGDAEDLIKAEPPLPGNLKDMVVSHGIDVNRLSKSEVFSKLRKHLPAYMLTGMPLPVLRVKDSVLVELGISRFVGLFADVHTDEPLVLIAIITWLEKNEPGYLHTHIMEEALSLSTKHNPSEAFFAYAMFQALRSGLPLNQILDFYIPGNTVLPLWTYEKAQIVVPTHFDHTTHRYHTVPYSYSSTNVPQAGKYIDNASELQEWLAFQGTPYSVTYPTTRVGPDFICLVKLESGRHFWLLGQTKVRESDNTIVEGDLVGAVQSVTPENVCKNAKGAEADGPSVPQQFIEALDALLCKVDNVLPSALAPHHAVGVLCISSALDNIQCLKASSVKTTVTPIQAVINWDRVGPILDNVVPGSRLWAQFNERSRAASQTQGEERGFKHQL